MCEFMISKKVKEFEDIGLSESLDIYKVALYSDDSWSCTCPPRVNSGTECFHIKQYQEHFFDPVLIPDGIDHYMFNFDFTHLDSFTSFKSMIKKYPRWVLEYIFIYLNPKYSLDDIVHHLKVSIVKLKELFEILNQYSLL